MEVEEHTPHKDWPADGTIQFENYSTRYREELDLVVRDIKVDIRGGEKVIDNCGSWSSGNATVSGAGGLRFKFRTVIFDNSFARCLNDTEMDPQTGHTLWRNTACILKDLI